VRGRRETGMSKVTVGLIALVAMVVLTWFGFTKSIPFRDHYEVKAVFKTSNNLRPASKVRIAGVEVGKVTKVEPAGGGRSAAVVTMRIDKKGLPIHRDATFAIRPRIFLEGNFFVDVQPGSPSAPVVKDDGEPFPINQTKTPVQFDQVLTALQSDTREDLKTLLAEYSKGLEGEGAKGFNRSTKYWERAYRDSAVVNQALQGERPHDLSGYLKESATVAEALDRHPEQLKSFITDFNTTAGALAREQVALENTVAELPRTLRAAQPALGELNKALPPLRRLARDFTPSVRSSGPTIDASMPFVREARKLVSPPELRGLTADLRPTVPSLARLADTSIPLYEQVRAASSCQNEVILPWSKDKIEDRNFPANGPVFQESVKWLPGIAGESRSGDANGQWFRVSLNPANFAYKGEAGRLFLTGSPIQGVNPPPPKKSDGTIQRAPLEPDVPCETQQAPDLRTIPAAPPAQTKVDQSGPAYDARYAKAKDTAITWLERQLKAEGLSDRLKVTTDELTSSLVGKVNP
jgi:phospholipid/cholesterol/gamma-HCH transport system substrate-binding protein